jgi:AbrB family looped-hinge helix DNA binding protein
MKLTDLPQTAVLHATVTSKGQITLPIELRRLLGIETGTDMEFTVRGTTVLMKPKRPISASFGFLRHLQGIDTTIPKEADRF